MSSYYFFDKIIWSPDGQYYALPLNTKLMIYNVESAGIVVTIENSQKIHSISFLMVMKYIINYFIYCMYSTIHYYRNI